MANSLTDVIPQVLAQSLDVLTEKAVIVRRIHTDWRNEVAKKGQTIDVPLPGTATVGDVTPGVVDAAVTSNVTPSTVPIALSSWKETSFALSDKEIAEVMDGVVPTQLRASAVALANQVTSDVYALYKAVPYYVGTAGTTPFASDLAAATAARRELNDNLAPPEDRHMILNTEAEANALMLRAFQDASFSGSADGLREGDIGRKLGFDWAADQLVPSHTAGTGSGYLVNDASATAGDTTVTVDTGSGTILVGDIVLIDGDDEPYAVTSALSGGSFGISPALRTNIADNATVTLIDSHDVNLAFNRGAFALAVRPLAPPPKELGVISMTMPDERTGLALRAMVKYEHYQTRWSLDILYGVKCIRPELACRVLG